MQLTAGKLESVPLLDGLRGVAILLVIIHHIVVLSYESGLSVQGEASVFSSVLHVLSLGWVGVDLFFVLSGFLVTRILLLSRHDYAGVRNFYIRRFLRIYPLYWLFLAMYFLGLAYVVFNLLPEGSPIHRFSNYSFYQDNQLLHWLGFANWVRQNGFFPLGELTHLWSIAIEVQFYLLIPWVFFLFRGRSVLVVLLFWLVLVWIYRGLVVLNAESQLEVFQLYYSTISRSEAICWGCLLAYALEANRLVFARAYYGLVAGLVFCGFCFMSLCLNKTEMMAHGSSFSGLFFAAVLCFAITSPKGGWCEKVFSNQVLRSFGVYSYSIYLFHPLVIVLFEIVGASPLALRHQFVGWPYLGDLVYLIMVMLCCYIIGWLFWHGYEKHFIQLKAKWVR